MVVYAGDLAVRLGPLPREQCAARRHGVPPPL